VAAECTRKQQENVRRKKHDAVTPNPLSFFAHQSRSAKRASHDLAPPKQRAARKKESQALVKSGKGKEKGGGV
jgi:hypothetical protein